MWGGQKREGKKWCAVSLYLMILTASKPHVDKSPRRGATEAVENEKNLPRPLEAADPGLSLGGELMTLQAFTVKYVGDIVLLCRSRLT